MSTRQNGNPTHRRTRRPLVGRPGGFTLLEVLLASLVLALGLVSVVALQTASIRALTTSQDIRIATQLGELTLQHLRADAVTWYRDTTSGVTNMPAADTGLAIGLAAMGNADPWVRPPAGDGTSPDIRTWNDIGLPNIYPASVIPASGERFATKMSHFCIQYRLRWIQQDELAMAQIRVFWPRNEDAEAWFLDCSVAQTHWNDPNVFAVNMMGPIPRTIY